MSLFFEALATSLRKVLRRSDRRRWRGEASLHRDWDGRAALMAAEIPAGATVLDLGAGRSALRDLLPEGCRYLAGDLVPRAPDVLACDLNGRSLPELPSHQVAVLAGVLEYLHDPRRLLAELSRRSSQVIVSYAVRARGSRSWLERRSQGWFNDFTPRKLEDLFLSAGFRVATTTRWHGQRVYRLLPDAEAGRDGPPRVSVISAVRNEEPFLEDSIASVIAQDMKSFELIVVDDASTDRSPVIASQWAEKDRRVRLLRIPEHVGKAAALNEALRQVGGEFVCQHDGDDLMPTDRLSAQVRFLDENPDVAGVYGDMDIFSEDGGSRFVQAVDLSGLAPRQVVIRARERALDGEVHPISLLDPIDGRVLPGTTMLLRRTVYDHVRFDPALGARGEDYDLWLTLLGLGLKLRRIPKVLLRYRRHDGQISRDLEYARAGWAEINRRAREGLYLETRDESGLRDR